ncbi:hypothetical protein ACLOJK_023497 [Asimina triloba]
MSHPATALRRKEAMLHHPVTVEAERMQFKLEAPEMPPEDSSKTPPLQIQANSSKETAGAHDFLTEFWFRKQNPLEEPD